MNILLKKFIESKIISIILWKIYTKLCSCYFLFEIMPKNSICTEIGVYKGAFSKKIIKFSNPKILHLIDPWRYQIDSIYEKPFYGGSKGKN